MFGLLKRKQNKVWGVMILAFCLALSVLMLPTSEAHATEKAVLGAEAGYDSGEGSASPLGYDTSQITPQGERLPGNPESPLDNAYLVNVNTGSNSGRTVKAIRIRYTSARSGGQYFEIIDPSTDLGRSILLLSQMGTEDLNSLPIQGLQADSVNSYLIRPTHEVSSIDTVEVILQGSGSWTCNGASVVQLDQVSGVDRRFEADGNVFVYCKGTLVSRLKTEDSGDGYKNLTINHSASEVYKLPMERCNEPYNSANAGSYVFRMDMADFYHAGLESLQPFKASDSVVGNFKDNGLNVIIRYKDTGGSVRTIKYPVVSSIVDYAVSKGVSKNDQIAGIIEQGETIAFSVELPDYAAFIDYTLDFQNATVANDNFSIIGMSFYDAEATNVKVTVDGGFLKYTFEGSPEYYYKADSITGSTIYPGQRVTYNSGKEIVPYEDGAAILPVDNRSMYLVEIRTDNVAGSAATAEAYAEITYLQQNDKTAASKEALLSAEIGDYYGYTAGAYPEGAAVSTPVDRFPFYYHTSEGGVLRYYIELEDVKQFKSISVRLDSKAAAWQISSVTIYSVKGYGKRSVVWSGSEAYEIRRVGFSAWRDYTRSRQGTVNTLASSAESALIHNGETVTIPFDSSNVISEDENETYDRKKEGISYDDICKDYGFTTARGVYAVTVQVGNDSLTDFNMGDCGSENYFYFQLLFKDGQRSPIVLANQQIPGDAFRAGEDATFYINTNRDFGDVEAVRIIPDNTAAKSEIFDKLKIDNIYVTQDSNAGVQTTWCFEDVGWIDIAYHDDGERTVGRPLSELAHDFDRTDKTFSVKIEFAVTTNANINGETPFAGDIQAEIEYVDKSNRTKILPVNMTKAMYTYNDNTAFRYETDTKDLISDPTQMFRAGKTDRFEVSFTNISMLKGIKFNVKATQEGMAWTCGSVSASVVREGGVVKINQNGEYQKSSSIDELCTNQTNLPASLSNLSPTERQSLNVSFTGNKIEFSSEEMEIHSKTPVSNGDRMNVFVSMKEGATSTLLYPMQAEIEFTTVNGKHMTSLATLTPSDDGRSAYISDMSASCMNTVTSVNITAIGDSSVNAAVNSVAIEQYRKDDRGLYQRVVCEYYINMEGQNATVTGGVTGTPAGQTIGNNTQKVYFGISQTEEIIKLIPEEKDMIARVLYMSTCAPYGETFVSEEVYLTEQNITEISTGKVMSLEFNENLVDRIVGLELHTVGNITVGVDAVYADLFETTKGVTQLKSSVSMIHERSVTTRAATWTMEADRGSVVPVEIAFTTASAQGSATGNGTNPVRLTVGYIDPSGNKMDRVYEDIRLALDTAGDFYAGKTQTARLLIPEAVSVTKFVIEPYDSSAETIASWKVDKVELGYLKDGSFVYTDSRVVDKFIFEEDPYTISTDPVIVMADIKITGDVADTEDRVANEKVAYIINTGATFEFTVIKNGEESNYKITTEQVTLSGAKMSAEDGLLSRTGNDTFVFKPPVKDTECYYRITIESTITNDAYIEITLTVPVKGTGGGGGGNNEQPQPSEETQPAPESESPTQPSTEAPETQATEETKPEETTVETEAPTEVTPEETEAP